MMDMPVQTSQPCKRTYTSICILGGGTTGTNLVAYLRNHKEDLCDRACAKICVYVGKGQASPALIRAAQGFCEIIEGTEEVREDFDLCITSPGIAPDTAFYQSARAHAKKMIGEVEFIWQHMHERWIAITGTNGKTTTTTLTHAMLSHARIPARAVGNIGLSVSCAACTREDDEWFVAELSSFQLAETHAFHPRAAALLNITPDHLEWHKTMDAYAQAKAQVFANLDRDDLAVISTKDSYCKKIYNDLVQRGMSPCVIDTTKDPRTQNAGFVEEDTLCVRLNENTFELISADRASLKGQHNVENMLCASALALFVGVPVEDVRFVLEHFKGLEHRLEYVGTYHTRSFINDSKATNIDATSQALTALYPQSIVVLLGGHDKQTDLAPLAADVVRKCRGAVVYGEVAPRMMDALVQAQRAYDQGRGSEHMHCQILRADHMADAFWRACEISAAQDTVLLSPACSSFDEFHNMEERGETFKDLVREFSCHVCKS